MQAQDELKAIFAELDEASDRALAGLGQVRDSVRWPDLPAGLFFGGMQRVLGCAFICLALLWLSGVTPV